MADSVLSYCCELVAQKSVCEVNHPNNVDQSQYFTQEEVDGVTSMSSKILLEIFLDSLQLFLPFLRLKDLD